MRVRPGQTPPEARTGGGDAAGEVVEIGRDVSGIKLGDRVMGRCAGGFAEFALVVDNIGADVLAPSLDALAVGGRFVTIGRMSGVTKGELDVDRLAERRLHLYGVTKRLRTPAQRAESAKRFAADLLPRWATAGSGRSSTAAFRSIRSPPLEPGSRPTSMSAKSSSSLDCATARAGRRRVGESRCGACDLGLTREPKNPR
jgi:hypothetical protein